jgi:formate dehydrogenase maturation protein FdhE
VGWAALVTDHLCSGNSNKELRQYLKGTTKDTWQLVNWLTHDRDANKTAASIAIHAYDIVVGHFVQILERERTDHTEECPVCKSRRIRTHFNEAIEPDGDYYMTCALCKWSSHSGARRGDAQS